MLFKKIIRKIIYREKSDYKSYIKYLRKRGVTIGEENIIVDVQRFGIDLTRPYLISIGNNNTISDNVTILTHDYSWSVISKKYPGEIYPILGKVSIGNNCFIGSHAIILPNVKIGNNVIIGSGAIVTRNVPDNTVYAGVPAKKICTLEEYRIKIKNKSEENLRLLLDTYREKYKKEPSEYELREHLFYLYSLEEIKKKNPQYFYRHKLDKYQEMKNEIE